MSKKNQEARVKKQEATKDIAHSAVLTAQRGILIIALGAPQYGRMAANLASSIRYADKDVKIHLVWSGASISHLSDAHKALFTSMAECPAEYYTKSDKTVYLKAKTFVYQLSPFEETIFLDADMIWFSNPHKKNATTLFNELKGIELTFQNRGHFDLHNEKLKEDYSNWCSIKEVKEKYFTGGIEKDKGRFYHLHSEFIYFARSESNRQFFALVQQIFDEPKVKPAAFDGDIPDELAFDIAVAVTGKNPHQENFRPIHWFAMDGKANLHELQHRYYGLSMGGNNLPPSVMAKYKMLAKFYAKHFGLPYSFSIQPKKRWSATRQAA